MKQIPEQQRVDKKKKAAYAKQYHIAHREKKAAWDKQRHEQKRELILLQHKKWRAANRDKINQATRLRVARRKQAKPQWLSKDQLLALDTIYKTARVLTEQTGVRHTVDHIVPLRGNAVCGLHVPWNLQILTASENSRKHNLF